MLSPNNHHFPLQSTNKYNHLIIKRMNHTCTKVTVRQRAIKNDRISLYLDYYPAVRNPETMQMSRREYLGIYIYAHPKNEMEREFNNDMLNKAEAIRCIRVQYARRSQSRKLAQVGNLLYL